MFASAEADRVEELHPADEVADRLGVEQDLEGGEVAVAVDVGDAVGEDVVLDDQRGAGVVQVVLRCVELGGGLLELKRGQVVLLGGDLSLGVEFVELGLEGVDLGLLGGELLVERSGSGNGVRGNSRRCKRDDQGSHS